jgi:hypothetical protein
MNLIKIEIFHLYIDPISSFGHPMFDDFNKLLQQSHDVFPLPWYFNHVELKEHLGFKFIKQNHVIHIFNLTYGSWTKVSEVVFLGELLLH